MQNSRNFIRGRFSKGCIQKTVVFIRDKNVVRNWRPFKIKFQILELLLFSIGGNSFCLNLKDRGGDDSDLESDHF